MGAPAVNRVGDTLEVAIWFNIEYSQEAIDAERGIFKAFRCTEEKHGVRLGEVTLQVLSVGSERVPDPPELYAGTPALMVGTADVVKIVPITVGDEAGFTNDLEPDDLDTLRNITRKAHHRNRPSDSELTDEQVDATINALGPDIAARALQVDTDPRNVH